MKTIKTFLGAAIITAMFGCTSTYQTRSYDDDDVYSTSKSNYNTNSNSSSDIDNYRDYQSK